MLGVYRSSRLQMLFKTVFLKISQNSQENASVGIWLTNLQASNFIKKRLQQNCFPVNIAIFLWIDFIEYLRWPLLEYSFTDVFSRFLILSKTVINRFYIAAWHTYHLPLTFLISPCVKFVKLNFVSLYEWLLHLAIHYLFSRCRPLRNLTYWTNYRFNLFGFI